MNYSVLCHDMAMALIQTIARLTAMQAVLQFIHPLIQHGSQSRDALCDFANQICQIDCSPIFTWTILRAIHRSQQLRAFRMINSTDSSGCRGTSKLMTICRILQSAQHEVTNFLTVAIIRYNKLLYCITSSTY
jgi:hypothetical protein